MLRTTSPDNYDKWTAATLPFTRPEVKNAVQKMSDIWFNDKYVYGGRKQIVSTNFGDCARADVPGPAQVLAASTRVTSSPASSRRPSRA